MAYRHPLILYGTIIAISHKTVPTGYLLCNGSAVSRTTYANLFKAIGSTYGSGNGSSTFNLPNLVGKFLEGDNSAGTSKAAGLPNITGTIPKVAMPWESAITGQGAFTCGSRQYVAVWASGNAPYQQDVSFDASRCSTVYSNEVSTVQPPAVTTLFCIKY